MQTIIACQRIVQTANLSSAVLPVLPHVFT